MTRGYVYDTEIAHNAVHPDEPHRLQHIAGCYTDTPPWKPPKEKGGQQVWESNEQLFAYNGRDVYNTTLSMLSQLTELEAENARFVHDLDVGMFHVAKDVERAGLPVSRERWIRWSQRSDFYMARSVELLRAFTGRPDFSPTSPPQLAWALYDKNGPCRLLPMKYTDPSKTHPQGQPSTDKSSLLSYKGHPFVDLLLDYRRWEKIKSTYIEGMPVSQDWRIRVRWKPLGARTGRWSSEPNLMNWGKRILLMLAIFEALDSKGRPHGGPWQLPLFPGDEIFLAKAKPGKITLEVPGIRECIVAPPGRKIVGADLGQAELRVLGALCGDEKLISLCVNADEARKYEPDCDPHAYVSAIAFKDGYLKADDKTRSALRDLEKRVIYGSFYGAGSETILNSIYDGGYEGMPIDIATVETILAAIFKAFPSVRPWRERELTEAKRTGRVTDALIGRRREFPLLLIDATVVYNYKMQCVRGGTRVLTTEGYLPVEHATCSASLGAPNQWAPSMTLGKRTEQLWETKLTNGHVLQTNEEHYLRVLRDDGIEFEWRAVGELREGDRIAQPLASAQEFGAPFNDADAYWLGYWIGNGSWSQRTGSTDQLVWCFGTRVKRFAHDEYAASFTRWAIQYGGLWKAQVHGPLTAISVAADSRLRQLLPSWGVDPTWRAKTKRVPDSIWRACLSARKAFLLGYMDADGTLSMGQPSSNTPNLELLRDLQLLARSCGVTSRIDGPYVSDRDGHMAWRLNFAGSLLRSQLAYGDPTDRQRFSRDDRLGRAARDRFLETYPRNPFSYATERSMYVLWSRLAHGGTTNPHTLQRMTEAAGDWRDAELYSTGTVAAVCQLEESADLYTLAVQHDLHRYDSAGIISKNSTVASMMNLSMLELAHQLPSVDPTAIIIAQVHDAIYVECDEHKADKVAALLERCMSQKLTLVPGADAMPFPAVAKIGDDWYSV